MSFAQLVVILIFAVPIIAVLSDGIHKSFNRRCEHRERMAELKAEANLRGIKIPGIEDLRQEMITLRDTTTQYDLSIEQTLKDLQKRLEYLENRVSNMESSQMVGQYTTQSPQETNKINL